MQESKRIQPPSRRKTIRQKCSILYAPDGKTDEQGQQIVERHTLYIDASTYDDGRLCEVFLDIRKDGSIERALFSNLAKTLSVALQCGMPLEEIAPKYIGTRFNPAGPVVDHPRIKSCSSVLDLIGRHLAIEFLGWEEWAHVKKESDGTGDGNNARGQDSNHTPTDPVGEQADTVGGQVPAGHTEIEPLVP